MSGIGLLAGCGKSGSDSAPTQRTPGGEQVSVAARPAGQPILLFLGTSLTAGLGVEPDSAYPAVMQRKADSLGLAWHVVNGGVSGETSAGLLRRLPWQLEGPLRVVVIETGANDGLRGLDVNSTRTNIEAIIAQLRAHDSTMRIVLVGMEAPPNMGPRFTAAFRSMFPALARREHLPIVPFLLEGVGGVDSLNQGDGIHPTPEGHRIVAENVWRVLAPLMRASTP